ncbi:peroxisomal targeting signal 1 receptor-like isoform X2 [Lycorma delicatula]|uniref:peroxisomal targeting signal 1 receptor-like isoform X2 n=1 Tax=Lycorma delicatula TaxID=130591 RepID=UPI003F519055
MSLKELVEGECGGTNSLVRLTSHFVQDRSLKDEDYRHPFHQSDPLSSSPNADQLVQQFLEETLGQSPQTFRMDSLLAEMRDLEGRAGPVQSPPVAQLAAEEHASWAEGHSNRICSNEDEGVNSWAEQYLESGKNFQTHSEFEDQYAIWKTDPQDISNQEVYELGLGPKWAKEYLESTENLDLDESQTLAASDLSQSEEYVTDDSKEQTDLQLTANQLLSQIDDPKLTYSKIGDGEVTIESGQISEDKELIEGTESEKWSNEFRNTQASSLWTSEFKNERGDDSGVASSEELFTTQLWDKLARQWNETISEGYLDQNSASGWANEFADYSASLQEYSFASDNPMNDINNALEEGIRKREAGDLPSAVLCFEAAVQKEPENSAAWEMLGVTQAEIEQDRQAIVALKKCLQCDPKNLTAIMTLAASYTNENYQNQACHALKEWLHANPKYTDLIKEDPESVRQFRVKNISSIMPLSLHDEVKDLYLAAARRNPSDGIDPDVQCGLGILFNLTAEQDKATDCFKAALQVRPDDCRLWNRLGATLANGNRSEEAVDAYHNALQLSPGFIRARFNLGITCVHLRAYREACEHLLTALNQQAAGRGVQGERSLVMSDSVWTTLRLAVSLMHRNDLLPAVNNRDLEKLNREFGLNE